MKRYIRTTTTKLERALTFRYPEQYRDQAYELDDLLTDEGVKHVMYDDRDFGFKFVIGRSGRTWNDLMKLINSVKSAKYNYVQTIFEEQNGRWVEVVDEIL